MFTELKRFLIIFLSVWVLMDFFAAWRVPKICPVFMKAAYSDLKLTFIAPGICAYCVMKGY